MFFFRKIWRALFSWNTRFEIRPFALLPTKSFLTPNLLPVQVYENYFVTVEAAFSTLLLGWSFLWILGEIGNLYIFALIMQHCWLLKCTKQTNKQNTDTRRKHNYNKQNSWKINVLKDQLKIGKSIKYNIKIK